MTIIKGCPTLFDSYGDVTITGEGLQILNHARYSWPLISEGFLACHTLLHGTSVKNGHPRGIVTLTPDTEHLAVKLSRLGSIAAGIRTPNLPHSGQMP